MTGPSERPDALELLARTAATGISRRHLVKLGAGAALGAILPEWAIPAAARAGGGFSKTSGSCSPQKRGSCSGVRAPWKKGCKTPVAKGKASEFNGCGPQSGLDLPALGHGDWVPDRPLELANFFDACKGHDCCYGQCGSDKSKCDSDFLKGMLEACGTGQGLAVTALFGGLNLAMCTEVAGVYHAAVHDTATGQAAYEAGQAEVCDCCQTYTVQFDSTVDLTPTAGYGWSGDFHLQYTAQVPLSTPADGSAFASGTGTGSYVQATGTITEDDGDATWSVAGGTGAPFMVGDFDPGALTVTLLPQTPQENYTITSPDYSNSFPGPLWAFAFWLLERADQTTGQIKLALQPGPALDTDEPGVIATGTFDHASDLGTAADGPALDFAGTEHTTITVTAN